LWRALDGGPSYRKSRRGGSGPSTQYTRPMPRADRFPDGSQAYDADDEVSAGPRDNGLMTFRG
jgi:hypothetical protein